MQLIKDLEIEDISANNVIFECSKMVRFSKTIVTTMWPAIMHWSIAREQELSVPEIVLQKNTQTQQEKTHR